MGQMFDNWTGAWGPQMSGTGMVFVGLIGLLVIVLLGLGIVALVKYLVGRGPQK